MNINYFFCLNPKCEYAGNYKQNSIWYKKVGYHNTKAFGRVQRYICRSCGRTFSDQTFSLNYYLKKKTDFKSFTKQLISSNSNCFIARNNNMSSESVRIRTDRMAKNGLFLQTTVLDNYKINEELAADGFESYTRSKYYPNNINILVGTKSRFLYYFTESHSKRKGRVTESQQKRIQYEYNDKFFTGCTLPKQFKTLLEFIPIHCKAGTITLHTDEHKVYPAVLKELSHKPDFPNVVHIQTSSKDVRNQHNNLASINGTDRQLRKDVPNFRRKTVCHARNDRNMLARVAVYMVTNNFFKPKTITDKAKQVEEKHYTELNLDESKVTFWKSLFFEVRFMLSKVNLPEYFKKVWMRKTETPFADNWYPLPKFALQ